MNSVISLVSVLILTALILYLSYVFTKGLGHRMGLKRAGGCMEMLDRLPLGQDKAIAIVRTGNRYYLIGIASSQITLLAELPEETCKELAPPSPDFGEGQGAFPFRDMLKKYADRHKKD